MTLHPGQLVMCIDGHTQNGVAILQSGWVYSIAEIRDGMIRLDAVGGFWAPDRFAGYIAGVFDGCQRRTDISIFQSMLTKEPPIEDLVMTAYLMNPSQLHMDKVKPRKPSRHAV